ncbi:phosphatase PAP2 family protein [Streptomyces sp. OF3]|uniref:Phosphatase PAP2 family protein n=1 Tax=Streptomyces alkaliterrae TaxID=2213162 RepID=A0A7W3WH18_9ACTN|nr:phosphatase PAP2 family protein [Streptomyces alkaliterrae]MBB1252228.1 phosphatase PAP2 family protein [Streptomyces alkaliterrae]
MGAPTTRSEGEERVSTATPQDERRARPQPLRTLLRRPQGPRRPRIWFEIALIAVSYWVYSLIRNAVPEHEAVAQRHAQLVWDFQQTLGLAFEQTVNHSINKITWLIVGMNYYYATLHFVVTIGVLVWLYRRQPGRYGAARTVLFATTAVALVGYYFFPLAPPRLFDGAEFVDTVIVHGTWGSMASGDMANVSNQFAAMPSMHIGWSAWCGVILLLLARRTWVRALGVLYPVATLVVIVATGNHFWLDAVGGLLCLAFGFAVAKWWYRAHVHRLPVEAAQLPRTADDGLPEAEPAAETEPAAAPLPKPEGGSDAPPADDEPARSRPVAAAP